MTTNTPCEEIVWKVLPCIRRILSQILIKEYGLTQREVAVKLGLTEAAISLYVSGKRGYEFGILEDEILEKFKESADRVRKCGPEIVPDEICRLCKILRKSNRAGDHTKHG